MSALFVACLLGPERGRRVAAAVRAALGEQAQRALRLPRPEGLHATLFYAGALGDAAAERLRAGLARALAGCAAPELVLGGAGAFPRRGAERVLWVGLREEPERGALARLHAATLVAAEEAGLDTREERGRPFRPHVSVARPRTGGAVPASFYDLALEEPWRPDAVQLVASLPADGPRRYEARASFPLATA